jgi:hypothetical protein
VDPVDPDTDSDPDPQHCLEDGQKDEVECEEEEDGRHLPAAAEAVRTGEESLPWRTTLRELGICKFIW